MVAYVWQGYARIAEEEFKTQQSGGITTEADKTYIRIIPQMVRNHPNRWFEELLSFDWQAASFFRAALQKNMFHLLNLIRALPAEQCVPVLKPLPTFSPTGFVSIPVIKKRYFRHDSETPARLPT